MTRRRLTPGERDLWGRASRDVVRLDPKQYSRAAFSPEIFLARQSKADLFGVAAIQQKPKPKMRPSIAGNAAPPSSVFAAGDPRADRHIRRGRREIDATFDLHGHSQASARPALLGFITQARLRGWRCILIITGKGVSARSESAPHRGRGVLRARVRDWLNDPAFRQHVARASEAHPRHGGGGAFYVFLKR